MVLSSTDRIIVREIRGKEMLDCITAASTGHSGCMTTLHANSAEQAWSRMLQLYKMNNVPAMTDSDILNILQESIDIIIYMVKSFSTEVSFSGISFL